MKALNKKAEEQRDEEEWESQFDPVEIEFPDSLDTPDMTHADDLEALPTNPE